MRIVGVALLWALCAGFALGIFLRSLWAIPGFFALGLAIIAFVIIAACAFAGRNLKIALLISALCMACGAGILRMQGAILLTDPVLDGQLGQKVVLEGIVSDEPDERATQVRVPIQLLNSSVKILAVFPAHAELYYGEKMLFSGTLNLPKSFDAGLGRQFNYPGYLAAQGIAYELDRAQLESGDGFYGNLLVAGAYKIKNAFIYGIQQSLPEPHAGLAGGITVGDKRAMGKELTQEFQTVSLVHIVVLSGYNITIVISALFALLSKTSRYVRFGAGGVVAIFFAVMTGFASASLRSALMALISISGSLSGRIYRPDRALVLVGALMLLWNPYLLVFDPGFQLSFLACAGLIIFSPVFSEWFARIPKTLGVQEILVSTCSAQVAVLPLLLFESGRLSLVSLPANLLALVAVPPAMLFSAIAAVCGLVVQTAGPLFGFPAYLFLTYILGLTHFLANVPFAAVSLPAFSAWLLLPTYAILFGYGLYLTNKKAAQET